MNDRPTATIAPARWNTPRWLPLALGVAAGVLLVILGDRDHLASDRDIHGQPLGRAGRAADLQRPHHPAIR